MTTLSRSSFLPLIALLLLLAVSSVRAAREAVLTLKDGRTVKGEVVEENDKAVSILISGIKTPYGRDLIKSIEYVKTVEEEYAEKRAKVADDNVAERYQLARWLYDKKAYPQAKAELDDLAKRDPKNADVALLKRIVEEKIKAPVVTPPTPPNNGNNTPTPPTPPVQPPVGDLPKDRLDASQINRIRVLEINEDLSPRVTVPRTTVEKFLKEYADDTNVPKGPAAKNKFMAQKDLDKLKLMMTVGAKELYGDVVSHDDPPAIRDFRNLHRNYVLSFCATAECHGGAKAGKFFLFNSAPTSNETIHTNFYILTQTKTATAFMVDRDYPTKSLILQFGLPVDKATTAHPDVPGFKAPMHTGDKDRTYQALLEWITKSLYRPEPKYDLNYKIPTLATPKVTIPATPEKKAPEVPAPKTPDAK